MLLTNKNEDEFKLLCMRLLNQMVEFRHHINIYVFLQMNSVQLIKDEDWYLCGDGISVTSLVMRRAISCASMVETTYFSTTIYQPPVCIHCGRSEDLLDDFHPYIIGLREDVNIVHPLCKRCHDDNKEAVTWGRKFFKKQKSS